MANPNFPSNGQNERVDALVAAGNIALLKLGIGSKSIGGTDSAAWHGVATHVDGGTFVSADGVVLTAGISGSTIKKMLVDSTGAHIIVGAAAGGAAVTGAPVLVGGSDGTNAQRLSVDASGHAQVVDGRVTDAAGTYVALRNPNIFKSATAAANGDNAIWTPTTGKKFRLMRFMVTLPNDTNRASGGDMLMKFRDSTTDMNIWITVYVPTSAGTTFGAYTTGWVDLGNGYLSTGVNNVLNFNLAAALTTSTGATVMVAGTEE